jgi:hypothetical protein
MLNRSVIAFISLGAVLCAVLIFVPSAANAAMIVTIVSLPAIYFFRTASDEKSFLTYLFLAALFLRLAFGTFLELYDLRIFFGTDALLYDMNGAKLVDYWSGRSPMDFSLTRVTSISYPGWGMTYLTGLIYLIFGRGVFTAQCFCAAVGAMTPGLVYLVSIEVFENKRVGRLSSIMVAVFPAFVVWSSQLLKDGLIISLLVLCMLFVLKLQKKFSITFVVLLVLSLFGILSLRFYIFYMVIVAVAGSLFIGGSKSNRNILSRVAVLILVGVGLTYIGATRNAGSDLGDVTDLSRVQRTRNDLAKSAESGFGEDIDVSTSAGALQALPLGFIFLMFAPFPWAISSFRQAITVPEIIVWWFLIPLAGWGYWWSFRHRLRNALPILIFTFMLTVAYSIYQGNVGTAYRQRTQIQVFLFMFIAVGWQLWKERSEDRRSTRRIHAKNSVFNAS